MKVGNSKAGAVPLASIPDGDTTEQFRRETQKGNTYSLHPYLLRILQ